MILVLNYLEKPIFPYIVHPTNHYQKYITDVLIDLNMIKKDNIIQLVSENPDVIICNTKSIDNGGRVMSVLIQELMEIISRKEQNIFVILKIKKINI